uniref:Uncharacterized protein n=1 Tax=Amphimedon queenslandica TaxID=400682 RepID=A0A1X7URR6_AMPQE
MHLYYILRKLFCQKTADTFHVQGVLGQPQTLDTFESDHHQSDP